jgi:hypothetical protein
MKTINIDQLANLLTETAKKGVTFGSVLYYVDESGARTANKAKVCKKLTFTPITLGSDYTRKIEKILKTKQGASEEYEFEAKKMSGRSLLCSTLVQSDRSGVLGIYGIVENHNKNKVRSKLFYNGKMYDRKELEALHHQLISKGEKGIFMPSYFKPKATKGQGEVKQENEFGIVTTHLKNIRKIKLGKDIYRVRD